MYPFSNCSWINFWRASSSVSVVGYTLQSITFGEPSFNSIAWSHGLDGGNWWASSSLKTLQCYLYSSGIITFVYCCASCASWDAINVLISHSWDRSCMIWSFSSSDRGVVSILEIWDSRIGSMGSWICWRIFSQLRDWIIMGRYSTSIEASLYWNLGSKTANQGYPKIRSSVPRSVTRNLICSILPCVWTWRSTNSEIIPALLAVPSIFQIFLSCGRCWVPSPNCRMSWGWMKLSVAPESTRICLSALAYAVWNEMGILILRYRAKYTVSHLSIRIDLPQAVGVELRQNPPSWRLLGSSCPSLPHPFLARCW